MGYMDNQNGKDYTSDEKSTKQNKVAKVAGSTSKKQHKSIFARLRDMITGEADNAVKNAKMGFFKWKASEGATNGAKNFLASMTPKKAALVAGSSGLSILTLLTMFTGYKNDGVFRDSNPIECQEGHLELPIVALTKKTDMQDNVDIMYDIFCNNLGYTDEFLVGMLSCMMAESGLNPGIIEETGVDREQIFYDRAGGGTEGILDLNPLTDVVLQAYHEYSNASVYTYETVKRDGYNCSHDQKGVGLGLIQWTGPRGDALIEGTAMIDQAYSWYDLPYQCAFLLAEFKINHESLTLNGSWRPECLTDEDATEYFFEEFVSGGAFGTAEEPGEGWDEEIEKRKEHIEDMREMVDNAKANTMYTKDTMSMIQMLTADTFANVVAEAQDVQYCVNKSYSDTSDIALAAASLSWLEKGEYADEAGAYDEIRRAARSPLLVNDWDYVDTFNNSGSSDRESHDLVYPNGCSCGGKHDLIACTEYYYYAHLIAYPKETGEGEPGYFSSCDRGTGTAVRISGADDNFTAGHPGYQLAYALGANSHKDRSDQHNAANQKLWAPSGFLRGCDFYSFEGMSKIEDGNIMISWNTDCANSLHLAQSGEAAWDNVFETKSLADSDDMFHENLRFPMSNVSTARHIITYTGEGTVQSFWGLDFLFQQYKGFDDADSLVRGDLSITIPEVMQEGTNYTAMFADDYGDQDMTFYMAEAKGAKDNEDIEESNITKRNTEYNDKTGLPSFKAWGQIFTRLIHNSDDDAYSKQDEKDLYMSYETDKDNYKDDAETEDHIVQYGDPDNEYTEGKAWVNKFFYTDWNSIGDKNKADGVSDGAEDYTDPAGETLWADKADDKWTLNWDNNGEPGLYWRYEYVTDVEYRLNQLLRFGMASMMCSYASENDAAIYQAGGYNESGRIWGNIYRRMSRIEDDIDTSGRFYYYNTVLSNDKFQDLVQLYSFEGAGDEAGEKHVDHNFGPQYYLSKFYDKAEGNTSYGWFDRRYGLTAADIENLMHEDGFGGFTMGRKTEDADPDKAGKATEDANKEFEEQFNKYVYTPLYEIDDTELGKYNKDNYTGSYKNGAHEGSHTMNEIETDVYYRWKDDEKVAQELYGLNPFLILDDLMSREINIEQPNNLIDNGGFRSDITTGDEKTDDRLGFIDRHFYATEYGNINMYAYAVLALNPSTGNMFTEPGEYIDKLKDTEKVMTLDVDEGTDGGSDTKSLYNSWGKVRYTDYIYAQTTKDNNYMGLRLFGDDNRLDGDDQNVVTNNNGRLSDENATVRDDYNRREWILIPYYHTHSQACYHSKYLLGDNSINFSLTTEDSTGLDCDWWDDKDASDMSVDQADVNKIDSQIGLNESCEDIHHTLAFDERIKLRGKYALDDLPARSKLVRYFLGEEYTGLDDMGQLRVIPMGQELTLRIWGELDTTVVTGEPGEECVQYKEPGDVEEIEIQPGINVPMIHKLCPGHKMEEGQECPYHCKLDGQEHEHPCTFNRGDPLNCLDTTESWKTQHGSCCHDECDDGDACHDSYGCNTMEWYYHATDNPVYMAIPVVENPKETFDITDYYAEENGETVIKCDKANLLQFITYDEYGFVESDYMSALAELCKDDPKAEEKLEYQKNLPDVYTTAENPKITYTIGHDDEFLGYFTVEGNVIDMNQRDNGETVDPGTKSETEDLSLIESLRNRMGAGKVENYPNSDSNYSVTQSKKFELTKLKSIPYEISSTLRDNGGTKGYGEYIITGTQHDVSPDDEYGNYGDPDSGGAGPDTSKGNKELPGNEGDELTLPWGSSLMREILGDEHVFHVRFGSQDKKVITGGDEKGAEAGYDFKYFDEFVDVDYDAAYQSKTTGELTRKSKNKLAEDEDEESGEDNENTGENTGEESGGSGDDEKGKNIPLPIKSADNAPYPSSLSREGASGKTIMEELLERYKETEEREGQDEGLNGDYGLWLTHASRGHRGLKTEYIVLKDWFGDVYDTDNYTQWYQYMLFKNIQCKDEDDVDGDGDTEESYIYKDPPDDATNQDATYGQGSNSHWRNLIELFNQSVESSRNFN